MLMPTALSEGVRRPLTDGGKNMYKIYENRTLIQQSELPTFEVEDKTSYHSFVYEPDFAKARAVMVQPDDGGDSFHANIAGREPYDWLERTVEVVADNEN